MQHIYKANFKPSSAKQQRGMSTFSFLTITVANISTSLILRLCRHQGYSLRLSCSVRRQHWCYCWPMMAILISSNVLVRATVIAAQAA